MSVKPSHLELGQAGLSIFAPTADQRYLLGPDSFLRTHYPRIRQRYSITDQDVTRLIDSLHTEALVVVGDYEVSGVSIDPDDDKFLACALEGRADYIVTGDPHLLNLKQYHGINILEAREFLRRISAPSGD